MDALILCGGEGKRLRPILRNKPKAMVDINGRPFLDILIDYLQRYGIKRIILGVGYKRDMIKSYYSNRNNKVSIEFSQEHKPLGTGGAVRNSQHLIKSNPFLAMNGDSFCDINIPEFLSFHKTKNALATVALVKTKDTQGYGIIGMDSSHRICYFSEKSKIKKGGFVNTGIYIFNQKIFSYMSNRAAFSLEYDFFPHLIGKRFYGYVAHKKLIDIGTSDRLKTAERIFANKKYKVYAV